MSAEAYARAGMALLPPGPWKRSGVLYQLMLAIGDGLQRIKDRAAVQRSEADPRTASEMLPEWEAMLGVTPDPGDTDAQRQARVTSAFTALTQGVRPADFQQILAPLLDLAPADVDVRENSRAFAIAVNDDRIIFQFHVYRDPALAGTPNIAGAQALLDTVAHSYTQGHVCESIDLRCDEATSLCDRDLLGV